MIKVTIEVLPYGFQDLKKTIAKAIIYNTGETQTPKRGNYKAKLFLKRENKVWKNIYIKDFPRQSCNIWYLLKGVLEKI